MDNTAQKQNQVDDNNQSSVQTQTQSQPQPTPTGSLNKEAEAAAVSDFVTLSEKPIVKDKEVAEAGVAEVTQGVELSKEHEQIGVRQAAETTPVKIEPSEKIQLPFDQTQAQQVVKTNKNSKSSIVWLAILMLKHFKKMRRKLLGKVI
jgi:hypothetical protein